ncbi:DUF1439 domain-containing protein [Pseudaeromonas sharmana]|uniref:DUF1439 domain-containing protein n=1 Tax=Pseudaeromonas sharmana TaxID=328412 RepID=A0ABV8CSU0_9GAMM
MIPSLLLALALNVSPQGTVDISEQQLTQYVNSKLKYAQQFGLPGLFEADIRTKSLQVSLARQQPQRANVQSLADFTLSLPNKPAINGTLQANFEAKPRYDVQQGAVYLDNFTLQDYQLQPAALQQQFAPLMGYLVKGLQQRLANQPAYRLNTKDQQQAWLKEHVTGFELQPGLLRLKTAP